MRILPPRERQEGRGLDAVLSTIGSLMRSILRHPSCPRRNTVVNTSYFARALVTAASVLLPIAGHGDAGTRRPASAPAAESVVDSSGNLHVPENYRIDYQTLGSWAVAADQGRGSKELHIVFA